MKEENASDGEEENTSSMEEGRGAVSEMVDSIAEMTFLAEFGVNLFSIIELNWWVVIDR